MQERDISKLNSEPFAIAVIGLAFRFPGDMSDEQTFWKALREGRDLLGKIPDDRWATDELSHRKRSEPGRSITFSAGVLSNIDEFDASFFGISPREAAWLDPQQRLLLELSWETFENAGIVPSSMAGTDCAVYVGIAGLDYGASVFDDLSSMSAHSMTGNTLSIAANRLSYVFDLHGPSMAVDTACSSSLVALHQACNSLRSGEASTALVGGVNLLLHPYPFVGFTKASMLSADGQCRAFDESGSGYVRSEGAAVLLLKPLDQAIADGDDIQAVIRASGVNADGARKTGLTIPSLEGQADLMREVLRRSGLMPEEIDFFETHGTGTAVGDPIETAAIGQVYGQTRSTPLPIGSVKTNLGHLEAASGMAGFVKTILAIKNRALPPLLHLSKPNHHIDFKGLNLELVTTYRVLERSSQTPLVAGVNSFGFGGANAHVLLQGYEAATCRGSLDDLSRDLSCELPPLFLSARTEDALRSLAARYADLLQSIESCDERASDDAQPTLDRSASQYYDIAYAAAYRRERLDRRLALRPDSIATAIQSLKAYAQGGGLAQGSIEDALPQNAGVVFVYNGNGAQWAGMAQALFDESPRFVELMQDLDTQMQPDLGFSVEQMLQSESLQTDLDDTVIAQPLLFVIQVAITQLLKEQGVKPSVVMGHSVGEIAAAWACGALTLEAAIRVIRARSQSQGLTRGQGRMAVVGLAASDVRRLLIQAEPRLQVELAAVNSPDNVTVSGDLADLERLQVLLEPQSAFFRLLDLDYAFHSQKMDAVREDLAQRLTGLKPDVADQAHFVSTVTGEACEGQQLTAEYWWDNVREPVYFSEAIVSAAGLGGRIFVEIGPNAILQRYIRDSLDEVNLKGRAIPTLRRQSDGAQSLRQAALQVQLLMDSPPLEIYFPVPGQPVRLPNYPWQRERYWYQGTSESLKAIRRRRVHPLLGWPLPEVQWFWENTLDPDIAPWLSDHRVGDAIVLPGAAYAEMALAAAREWLGVDERHLIVEQLDILAPMVFDGEHARSVRFELNPDVGGFQIKSRQRLSDDEWTLHAVGQILVSASPFVAGGIETPVEPINDLNREQHYQLASVLGLDYGITFQGLDQIQVSGDVLQAQIQVPETLPLASYLLHPALLDLCFQSLIGFYATEIESGQGVALLPVKIGRLDFCASASVTSLRAHIRKRHVRSVLADFELLDENGHLIARAVDCRFRAMPLRRLDSKRVSQWEILPWLRPHPRDAQTVPQPELATSLIADAKVSLTGLETQRQQWFQETFPLSEALILSFAYDAFRSIAHQDPQHWHAHLQTPYARWLTQLLRHEGLLQIDDKGYTLNEASDLPAPALVWQTLLRDSPQSLPQLTLIARVGQHLPDLLRDDQAGAALWQTLQQSTFAQTLYQDDPAYLGMRKVLADLLQRLMSQWSTLRPLRVLEIAPSASDLPDVLIKGLSPDHFEYVLALPDSETQSRQQIDYQNQMGVIIAHYDLQDGALSAETVLPAQFDVILVRHTLHSAHDPQQWLSQMHERLNQGGVLFVAERYSDWTESFLKGLNPAWWHEADECTEAPTSSLLTPQDWLSVLEAVGFEDSQWVTDAPIDGLQAGTYLLISQKNASSPDQLIQSGPASDRLPQSASWLLLADEASASLAQRLAAQLETSAQQVEIHPVRPLLGVYDHVVSLLGWQTETEETTGLIAQLLRDVQALVEPEAKPARLWLMTRGGALQAQTDSIKVASNPQAAVWGFGRVVMNECVSLSPVLIDLAGELDDPALAERLANDLLWPDGADEIILSDQARHCLVLQPKTQQSLSVSTAPLSQTEESLRFRLDFQMSGQLRNLRWFPAVESLVGDQEVEVRTEATGLNFRDVMYIMGLLPDEAVENGFAGASLGLEFSGVVSRVGASVTDLKVGDAVMGFGRACFSSHVVTRANALARKPAHWSFESAATVPTVFLTVYYALKQLADLRSGERVLIHGAAGGVGMAAIQLARYIGAEIHATAGSDEKRDFVRMLGADYVYDSRSLAFADEVLVATQGEGVDVVLNSLAGEAMRRSLETLKPFGRFLELGKRDFFENTSLGLRPFKDNISYFGVDADQLLIHRPELAGALFADVMVLFHEDVLSPLPYRLFGVDQIVEAFRTMQQARHIGKIVVPMGNNQRPAIERPEQAVEPIQFDPNSTWIVTGGLSGFGAQSAKWLASRGVKHLVLVGRRGPQTPGAQALLDALTQEGTQAVAMACDVTDRQAVDALVEQVTQTMPPLKGVLHASARFDDQWLVNLDVQSLETVLNAKLLGAWHLHEATRVHPLDYFVMYSSVTTALGNPGQANYVAANGGLEGLAVQRQQMGLPATCIAWGPIADAGYLERNTAIKDALAQRLGKAPMTAAQALQQLDSILASGETLSMPANFDWQALSRLPSAASTRFLWLNHQRQGMSHDSETSDIGTLFEGKTMKEIHAMVRDLVTQDVAQVLSIGADRIGAEQSLYDLGMDSLMAVELVVAFEQRFGIQIPVMLLSETPTVDGIATRVVSVLMDDTHRDNVQTETENVTGVLRQHETGWSQEEAQALTQEARKLRETGVRLIE